MVCRMDRCKEEGISPYRRYVCTLMPGCGAEGSGQWGAGGGGYIYRYRKGKKGNTKKKEENWTRARHVHYTGINCHHAFPGTADEHAQEK